MPHMIQQELPGDISQLVDAVAGQVEGMHPWQWNSWLNGETGVCECHVTLL